MMIDSFITDLSSLAFENVFNPYTDQCDVYDTADAPKKRRALLKEIISAASKVEVDAIWVGRDLGYRGGRRTGLALTDDIHLAEHAKRWNIDLNQITKGKAIPERTAAIIWATLMQIPDPIFLWNVFPLHPYEAGSPFSNRAHNAKERYIGEEFLSILIDILKPKRIIAIGNDAEKSVLKLKKDSNVFKVRHPSYGGQSFFIKNIYDIYELNKLGSEIFFN